MPIGYRRLFRHHYYNHNHNHNHNRNLYLYITLTNFRRPFSNNTAMYNRFGIELLPESISKSLFKTDTSTTNTNTNTNASPKDWSEEALIHLQQHNLPLPLPTTTIPTTTTENNSLPPLTLPKISSKGIEDHILTIGHLVGYKYRKLIDRFITASTGTTTTQKTLLLPGNIMFSTASGWTKYSIDGCKMLGAVDYPSEDDDDGACLVFDVETAPLISKYPIVACALGVRSFYVWVSPFLGDSSASVAEHNQDSDGKPSTLIPIGPSRKERLIIGHNISYDRARIKEEYTRPDGNPNLKFLDTLSLHVSIGGLSGQQRGRWLKNKKESLNDSVNGVGDEDEDYNVNIFDPCSDETSGSNASQSSQLSQSSYTNHNNERWLPRSSMNNLVDVCKLHCPAKTTATETTPSLDKSILTEHILKAQRKEDLSLQRIIRYCLLDCHHTKELFLKVWPKFLEKCPHPVSFAAQLSMGKMFLPLSSASWTSYHEGVEKAYQRDLEEIDDLLLRHVNGIICKELLFLDNTSEGRRYISELRDHSTLFRCPWYRRLDWQIVAPRYTKTYLNSKGEYVRGGKEIGNTKTWGMPHWWKDKLFQPSTNQAKISTKSRILPYLLRMSWNGHPVHWREGYGWTFSRNIHQISEQQQQQIEDGWIADSEEDGVQFHSIPHPSGSVDQSVGCLFSKDFLPHIKKGILRCEDQESQAILERLILLSNRWSFWTGYRERVKGQFVVDVDGVDGVCEGSSNNNDESNGKNSLILPTILPMGTVTRRAVEPTWMTASNAKHRLAGSELKSLIRAPSGYSFVGADVDSQELWISSLLGDAQFGLPGSTAIGWMTLKGSKATRSDLHSKTAEILGMSRDDAKIFNYGRIYGAGQRYAAQLLKKFNPLLSEKECEEKAGLLYQKTKGMTSTLGNRGHRRRTKYYYGGSESFMFNSLEAIANSPKSQTPALSVTISDALLRSNVDNDFITSRVNWAVQSSGVDYLHILVVGMEYLLKKYAIQARLSLTIHDELRYLVKKEDELRCAMALQIVNLWTRAHFSSRVGIQTLPLSVSFFSSVDIDSVLRKEVDMDCRTVTNDEKLPDGRSLGVNEIIKELAVPPNKCILGPIRHGDKEWGEDGSIRVRSLEKLYNCPSFSTIIPRPPSVRDTASAEYKEYLEGLMRQIDKNVKKFIVA